MFAQFAEYISRLIVGVKCLLYLALGLPAGGFSFRLQGVVAAALDICFVLTRTVAEYQAKKFHGALLCIIFKLFHTRLGPAIGHVI